MDKDQEKIASEQRGDAATCGPSPGLGCSTLKEIAEKVCKNVPHGFIISLCMENGCAWVELDKLGRHIPLPDSADKTLVEQLNDALCVANGFIESNPTEQGTPHRTAKED